MVRVVRFSLYLQLIVWGDQIAVFGVRENVRKRMDRVILRIPEFTLLAEPARIVETFQWADTQLHSLGDPPGRSEADRERLRDIEARWLALSAAAAH
jgi:hypothetical protein